MEESVRNPEVIDKNERKMLGETMGSLDPTRGSFVFLGNVIAEDGLLPRMINLFS